MSIQSIPPTAVSPAIMGGGRAADAVPTPQPQVRQGIAGQAKEAAPPADASGSAAEIAEALETVRTALALVARNLQFSVDDDTGKTVVRIIDSSTNEVIKQFPSEEILAIARSIDKLQGLLLRQEA